MHGKTKLKKKKKIKNRVWKFLLKKVQQVYWVHYMPARHCAPSEIRCLKYTSSSYHIEDKWNVDFNVICSTALELQRVFFTLFFYPRENSGSVSNIFHACHRFLCLLSWKNKLILEGGAESADTLVVIFYVGLIMPAVSRTVGSFSSYWKLADTINTIKNGF